LNIDLEINNEKQNCKIGTGESILGRGRVNEGDSGEEYG
jgi:hypothetical protein